MLKTNFLIEPFSGINDEYHKPLNLLLDKFEKLNEILSEVNWWESQLMGIIVGFILSLIPMIIGWRYRYCKEKTKIKELQISALNYTMVALDSAVTTLLQFKKDFIERYKPVLKEIKGSGSKEARREIFERISARGGNILLESFPRQIFDETSLVEKLEFMLSKEPTYLHTFHKIKEMLYIINYDIEERNAFIKQCMNGFQENEIKIDMLVGFGEALVEHVEFALVLIKVAAEHIEDYRCKFYPKENTYKFRTVFTKYEKLMPSDGDIKEYRDRINNSRDFRRK